jgi:hypothetical protein
MRMTQATIAQRRIFVRSRGVRAVPDAVPESGTLSGPFSEPPSVPVTVPAPGSTLSDWTPGEPGDPLILTVRTSGNPSVGVIVSSG